jgi:hypothetical protein
VKIEIAKQDEKQHFIKNQLANYGIPIWSINEKFSGSNKDQNLYFIPLIKKNGQRVEAMIAAVKSGSNIIIDIVDRKEIERYFSIKDGYKQRINLDCFLINYVGIEQKVFGKSSDEYKKWLVDWIKLHQFAGLEIRDICSITTCITYHLALTALEARTISCSTYYYQCGGSTSGGTVGSTPQSIDDLQSSLLTSNSDYKQLNDQFLSASPILWALFKDVAIEIAVAVIKKQVGTVSAKVIDGIKGIAQGNILQIVESAVEIAGKDNEVVILATALKDAAVLSIKANKIVGQVYAMFNSLGSDRCSRLWEAMKKGVNILDMDMSGGAKGMKIVGKSIGTLWTDIKTAFGNPTIFPDGRLGEYFTLGSLKINFYPVDDTNGLPAISISVNGTIYYKFRT